MSARPPQVWSGFQTRHEAAVVQRRQHVRDRPRGPQSGRRDDARQVLPLHRAERAVEILLFRETCR